MTSPMTEMSERASLSGGTSSPANARDVGGVARGRQLLRSPYPRVVGRVLRRVARAQIAAWDRALGNVRRAQEKTLAALLDHAKETQVGRAHDFARIRGYDDFARRVPIGDYDSFSPYID